MSQKSSRLRSFVSTSALGLVPGALALGVAELAAGVVLVRSPVIAVGDSVIDMVPAPVKDFAIATFGTNDKIALLVGIGITLVLFAMAVGYVARRSLVAGSAAVVLLCVIGLAAGLASPDPVLTSLVPCTIGAISGVTAMVFLRRRYFATRAPSSEDGEIDRRGFLKLSLGLAALAAAVAVAGRFIGARVSAAASRAAVILPRPVRQLAPISAGTDLGIDGVAPFVTPNRDFYRIDTALAVPQIPTETWSLRISGMVGSELNISYQELLNRSLVEEDITMTCVSNVVGGDLVGNARWLGLPLRNLLDEAGVDPARATQVIGRSADGYECGFPTSAAYDGRACIVAVGMNGEPLPLEHGFPARLVTAGLYGYVSATKWLTEIELSTMEDFDSYWVRRNWAKEAPIKTQSRIDSPRALANLDAGAVAIGGVAWAQTRGIDAVEVRIDNGPWLQARLGEELNDSTWRQWTLPWDATPGSHRIAVRATDSTGNTQTEQRADPIPDGASGWHSILVTVRS